MVVLSLLDDLVVNHEANRDILTTIDWIIVPILNPDGYVYTHLNVRLLKARLKVILFEF